MAKVTHIGPGDVVSLDGLDIAKGKTVELDENQIRRLHDAGTELEIDRSASLPPPEVWAAPAPASDAAPAASKTGTSERKTAKED